MPAFMKVGYALDLIGAVFFAAGFIVAAVAFRRSSRSKRRDLLAVSAASFAAYGTTVLAGDLIFVLEGPGEFLPPSQLTEAWIYVGSALALVVAAALVGLAMGSASSSGRLALGCVGLTLYFALGATGDAYHLSWVLDLTLPHGRIPGSITVGLATSAGGKAVAALGAAIAVGAFAGRVERRNATLAVAAIGLALGFLLDAVGQIILLYLSGSTDRWLDTVASILLAVAAGVGAAFWRPLQQRHGPDLAVLADPA